MVDRPLSLAGTVKRRIFTIAVAAVLFSSLFAVVRDRGGAPEIRQQLIGTWEWTGFMNAGMELPFPKPTGERRLPRMTLHADGSVTYGVEDNHKSTWHVVDHRHFHIVFPGMADGATKEEGNEIISLSSTRLVVRPFDPDGGPFLDLINKSEFVYKRVVPSTDLVGD